MCHEKLLTEREALMRVDPYTLKHFAAPQVGGFGGNGNGDADGLGETTTVVGLGCAAGAATGRVVFDAEESLRDGVSSTTAGAGSGSGAGAGAGEGKGVVFVKDASDDSLLEDIFAAKQASAVIIVGGGVLTDLACVCRTLGVPVVVLPASAARVEHSDRCPFTGTCTPRLLLLGTGEAVHAGDVVTVDGSHGRLLLGAPPLGAAHKMDKNLLILLKWADKYRKVRVRPPLARSLPYIHPCGPSSFCQVRVGAVCASPWLAPSPAPSDTHHCSLD